MDERISGVFWCELLIDTADSHPSIVTELTGIPHSKLFVKGEQIIYRNGSTRPNERHTYNGWLYKQKIIKIKTANMLMYH